MLKMTLRHGGIEGPRFNGIFLSVAVLAIYGLREASDIREPVYGVTVSTLVLVTLSDVA